MGLTPVYGWPYPDLNSRPDGATQMKDLALATETTLKAQINAPIQQWTPTFTGFTLGNGVVANAAYRKVGGLCFIHLRINAAASAPTTAFTGAMQVSLPVSTVAYPTIGMGVAVWTTGGAGRLGVCQSSTSASNLFDILAVKQADLTINTAGSIWGTAAWAVGTVLQAALTYPI